jgi:hypothetical protein
MVAIGLAAAVGLAAVIPLLLLGLGLQAVSLWRLRPAV